MVFSSGSVDMGTLNPELRREWSAWVLRNWTEHDDAVSVVRSTPDNPFCIQPYQREAFVSPLSKGWRGMCSHPGCAENASWMLHPLRTHWWARCDEHITVWTGYENRVRD